MRRIPLRRGDVWEAWIPRPDKPQEAPMRKHCVILQDERDRLFRNSPTVVVAVITTNHVERLFPTDVYLPPEECQNGGGAKIILNQFHTIPKSSLIRYRYSLFRGTIPEVDRKILVGIGIIRSEEMESIFED